MFMSYFSLVCWALKLVQQKAICLGHDLQFLAESTLLRLNDLALILYIIRILKRSSKASLTFVKLFSI